MDLTRRMTSAYSAEGGSTEITFPITFIEGDNGDTGKQFYQYVKNGQYSDDNIVYLDWNGFIIWQYQWEILSDNNYIGSAYFEVVDAYDPQGSPGHYLVQLSKEGILTIFT